jgi:hypothetical protein
MRYRTRGPRSVKGTASFSKTSTGMYFIPTRAMHAAKSDAPQLAADLRRTIAAPERGSILAAIQVCVQLYRRLRSAEARPIEMRTKAEAAALEYLARIEEGGETNS